MTDLSKAIEALGVVEVAHPRSGENVLVAYHDASLGGWRVRNDSTGKSQEMPKWWTPERRYAWRIAEAVSPGDDRRFLDFGEISEDEWPNAERITADLETGQEVPC